MARRFKLTEHALLRFAERHPEFDELGPDESRQAFHAELEHGVPFGAQFGDEELYLLPCGYVAVVMWCDGVGIVKTVLTKDLAIANMQSHPAILRVSRFLDRPVRGGPGGTPRDASHADPPLAINMRRLAEKHLAEGIGKKQRNAVLRELGYDPSGEAGDVYRAVLRAARETMRAVPLPTGTGAPEPPAPRTPSAPRPGND